jgi:TolB-like protein/Tfp pilus assembly protein PilF
VGSPDAAALLSLAESIADGEPIDWVAAEERAPAGDRAIVRQLRILSDLAGLHRSFDPIAAAAVETAARPADAAARQGVASPAIGTWAHLALVERLGGGSFGDVYRAWDRHLERDVALKLLRTDESLDDLGASRIAIEGRLLARVRHPNVITVHGVDVHERRVGLWMDLVRGVTLEQQLAAHGPLSAREAALVGIDLCRALAAIHGAGLIHRDVKAQNVMREDGGRIVLMDLGTGREAGALGRAATPDLAGTPLYLAPEIFSGAAASERTDLYSLGVLIYHLVTGAFPVRATTMPELHEGHKKGRSVGLRDARADLPTSFVRVVNRAIASDPERRYATAGALEADLVHSLEDTTPASSRAGAGELEWSAWITVHRAGMLAATLTALVAVAALGWWIWRGRPAPAAVAPAAIRSIAVLPLVNLSGDPAQDYFADGMTDQLIGTFSGLGGVNVISRTSAMQFKGSKKSLPEIARALNVDAVLEGSVMIVPGNRPHDPPGASRVRINARLIYAGSDTQLWDRTFEAIVSDVLVLQRQVARAVADGINLHLTSQQQRFLAYAIRAENVGTQQFDVFDLYLRGRYAWNLRTEEGLKESIQYFQEAIDRDHGYAPAFAGLADAYALLGEYGFLSRTAAESRAVAAASKAIELDDTLAEAHTSLAAIHNARFEWDAAQAGYQRAIALKPGYATAHHWYAAHLTLRGRFPEALREIEEALVLDPLSVSINGEYGAILMLARRYDDAIAQLQKAIQMNPTLGRIRTTLVDAYSHKREYGRALAEAEQAAPLSGRSAEVQAAVGYADAMAGRRGAALEIANELAARYARGEDETAGAVAAIHAALGDNTAAFQWLERARERREAWVAYLKVDPKFDTLHSDSRFTILLASLGLSR